VELAGGGSSRSVQASIKSTDPLVKFGYAVGRLLLPMTK